MMTTGRECQLTAERTALFEFALNAMEWMQRPTDRGRDWLIEAARDTADLTGIPERFESFADWLEQQQTSGQDETGGGL